MQNNKLLKILDEQQFEEFNSMVSEMTENEIFELLNNLDDEMLIFVFSKLPVEVSAKIFLMFDIKKENYLVENIKDVDFLPFSEELLNIDDIEKKVDKEIFGNVLIRAEAESRHNKLIEIIDNIESKKFALLKPILSIYFLICYILIDYLEAKLLLIGKNQALYFHHIY